MKAGLRMAGGRIVCGTAVLWIGVALGASAQASAIPSAQAGAQTAADASVNNRGRKLLDQMVQALGGAAWLQRRDIYREGKGASFYKGAANMGVAEFEDYIRLQPFGERIVIVSKQGVFIPTTKRDVAEVWTKDGGYEVTYKGRTDLPVKDVVEYERRRHYTLETIVNDWLRQPDVVVTYDGTGMVDRHLVDEISVLTSKNEGATLALDEATHLPLSRTFEWRDPTYKDVNTDIEQYDDYHVVEGVMTPLTITRLTNGDMVSQRFYTKVSYALHFSDDLFNPDRKLEKKTR